MYLVAGATGNIGSAVVRALLAEGAAVRALVRDVAAGGVAPGAEPVAGNLDDPASMSEAFEGADAAFFLPGYADMAGLYAAAKQDGVQHVVQLSGRSAVDGDLTNAVSAYMIRSEEAARISGIAWTIVRPSAFHTNTFQWLRSCTRATS